MQWEAGSGLLHKVEFNRNDVSGADVIKQLVNACSISDLSISEPPIEEIVAQIYRDGGVAS